MLKNLFFGSLLCFPLLTVFAQNGIQRTDRPSTTEPILFLSGNNNNIPAEGSITGYHSDGNIHYMGTIKKFKLHGSWQRWYINNTILEEGRLIKGIPEGEWKVWYPNGTLRYIRTYSYKKNEIIRQEWRRPHPKMNLYPITKEYLKDKNKVTAQLQTVAQFELDADAADFPALFNECLPHGLFMNFREDGSVADSGYYKNGLKQGIWIERQDSNSYWTGTYNNGKKTDTWKLVGDGKKIIAIVSYKEGQKSWEKKY